MSKYLISLVMLGCLAMPAWSQEENASAEPDDNTAASETTEAIESPAEAEAEAEDDEVADDADLDSQTYEEDDDDFVPTEEIPADEPIPFPSNI
jgi:hypothetical protein